MKLPDAINRYLGHWFAGQRILGYLLLDENGTIEAWGGRLEELGIGPLKKGCAASDRLMFMEGLLPPSQEILYLPMVKHDGEHVLDVHLFRIDAGYGLVLMDAGEQARQTAQLQQQVNLFERLGRVVNAFC